MITIPSSVANQYERFSLYNSPYPAHESGCAIDLYPSTDDAVSPVSGTVQTIKSVQCPEKTYATSKEYLLTIECESYTARMLHINPIVTVGEKINTGDCLGTLIRSGFFNRWVDKHIHLEFRSSAQDTHRASGSLQIEVDVSVTGINWDGAGTICESGSTYILINLPFTHTDSGFVGLADDDGIALDGGLTHYNAGGTFSPTRGERSLLGTVIGVADGRDIQWYDTSVYINNNEATGLSLFAKRVPYRLKVIFDNGHEFDVGDKVKASVDPAPN